MSIADVGRDAAQGPDRELANLRQRYALRLTVTIARREIRKWLRESTEGDRVEGKLVRCCGTDCRGWRVRKKSMGHRNRLQSC